MAAAATPSHAAPRRPRVVIVGAGFGGLAAAQRAGAYAGRTSSSIDRRNYHLFQPLLYQVATAALSPADIAWPIRAILAPAGQRVGAAGQGRGRRRRAAGRSLFVGADGSAFDYLVLATGAAPFLFRHGTSGRWTLPGLKKISDATDDPRARADGLRARRGHRRPDRAPASCSRSSSWAAGRPGSRWPGRWPSWANHALASDFRAIDPMDHAGVILVKGRSGRVLSLQFAPNLYHQSPTAQLERLRVAGPGRSQAVQLLRRRRCDGRRRADRGAHGDLGRGRDRVTSRKVARQRSRIAPDGFVVTSRSSRSPTRPRVFAIGDTVAFQGAGQAYRCPGSPNQPSRWAPMSAGRSTLASAGGGIRGRSRSPIATRATSPPSAARRQWRTSGWIKLSGFSAWATVGGGARLVPDRVAQPAGGRLELDVELRHVRAGCAVDRRFGRGCEGNRRAQRCAWPPEGSG